MMRSQLQPTNGKGGNDCDSEGIEMIIYIWFKLIENDL